MPLYIADYLADTGHLTAAEHGAYLLLIMHYWRMGSLPTDEVRLARIARMNADEWAVAMPSIASFFTDGWKHGRIELELKKSADSYDKRAAAGRKGGKTKSEKQCSSIAMAEQSIAIAEPQAGPQLSPSLSPSPSLSLSDSSFHSEARERASEKEMLRKPESRLPDDWKPGEGGFLFARRYGFLDPEIVRLLEQFRYNAKQNDRMCADWDAAWCSWVIKGAELAGKSPPRDPSEPPVEAVKIAVKTAEWQAWWDHHGRNRNSAGASFGQSQMTAARDRSEAYIARSRWPPGHKPAVTKPDKGKENSNDHQAA